MLSSNYGGTGTQRNFRNARVNRCSNIAFILLTLLSLSLASFIDDNRLVENRDITGKPTTTTLCVVLDNLPKKSTTGYVFYISIAKAIEECPCSIGIYHNHTSHSTAPVKHLYQQNRTSISNSKREYNCILNIEYRKTKQNVYNYESKITSLRQQGMLLNIFSDNLLNYTTPLCISFSGIQLRDRITHEYDITKGCSNTREFHYQIDDRRSTISMSNMNFYCGDNTESSLQSNGDNEIIPGNYNKNFIQNVEDCDIIIKNCSFTEFDRIIDNLHSAVIFPNFLKVTDSNFRNIAHTIIECNDCFMVNISNNTFESLLNSQTPHIKLGFSPYSTNDNSFMYIENNTFIVLDTDTATTIIDTDYSLYVWLSNIPVSWKYCNSINYADTSTVLSDYLSIVNSINSNLLEHNENETDCIIIASTIYKIYQKTGVTNIQLINDDKGINKFCDDGCENELEFKYCLSSPHHKSLTEIGYCILVDYDINTSDNDYNDATRIYYLTWKTTLRTAFENMISTCPVNNIKLDLRKDYSNIPFKSSVNTNNNIQDQYLISISNVTRELFITDISPFKLYILPITFEISLPQLTRLVLSGINIGAHTNTVQSSLLLFNLQNQPLSYISIELYNCTIHHSHLLLSTDSSRYDPYQFMSHITIENVIFHDTIISIPDISSTIITTGNIVPTTTTTTTNSRRIISVTDSTWILEYFTIYSNYIISMSNKRHDIIFARNSFYFKDKIVYDDTTSVMSIFNLTNTLGGSRIEDSVIEFNRWICSKKILQGCNNVSPLIVYMTEPTVNVLKFNTIRGFIHPVIIRFYTDYSPSQSNRFTRSLVYSNLRIYQSVNVPHEFFEYVIEYSSLSSRIELLRDDILSQHVTKCVVCDVSQLGNSVDTFGDTLYFDNLLNAIQYCPEYLPIEIGYINRNHLSIPHDKFIRSSRNNLTIVSSINNTLLQELFGRSYTIPIIRSLYPIEMMHINSVSISGIDILWNGANNILCTNVHQTREDLLSVNNRGVVRLFDIRFYLLVVSKNELPDSLFRISGDFVKEFTIESCEFHSWSFYYSSFNWTFDSNQESVTTLVDVTANNSISDTRSHYIDYNSVCVLKTYPSIIDFINIVDTLFVRFDGTVINVQDDSYGSISVKNNSFVQCGNRCLNSDSVVQIGNLLYNDGTLLESIFIDLDRNNFYGQIKECTNSDYILKMITNGQDTDLLKIGETIIRNNQSSIWIYGTNNNSSINISNTTITSDYYPIGIRLSNINNPEIVNGFSSIDTKDYQYFPNETVRLLQYISSLGNCHVYGTFHDIEIDSIIQSRHPIISCDKPSIEQQQQQQQQQQQLSVNFHDNTLLKLNYCKCPNIPPPFCYCLPPTIQPIQHDNKYMDEYDNAVRFEKYFRLHEYYGIFYFSDINDAIMNCKSKERRIILSGVYETVVFSETLFVASSDWLIESEFYDKPSIIQGCGHQLFGSNITFKSITFYSSCNTPIWKDQRRLPITRKVSFLDCIFDTTFTRSPAISFMNIHSLVISNCTFNDYYTTFSGLSNELPLLRAIITIDVSIFISIRSCKFFDTTTLQALVFSSKSQHVEFYKCEIYPFIPKLSPPQGKIPKDYPTSKPCDINSLESVNDNKKCGSLVIINFIAPQSIFNINSNDDINRNTVRTSMIRSIKEYYEGVHDGMDTLNDNLQPVTENGASTYDPITEGQVFLQNNEFLFCDVDSLSHRYNAFHITGLDYNSTTPINTGILISNNIIGCPFVGVYIKVNNNTHNEDVLAPEINPGISNDTKEYYVDNITSSNTMVIDPSISPVLYIGYNYTGAIRNSLLSNTDLGNVTLFGFTGSFCTVDCSTTTYLIFFVGMGSLLFIACCVIGTLCCGCRSPREYYGWSKMFQLWIPTNLANVKYMELGDDRDSQLTQPIRPNRSVYASSTINVVSKKE